MSAVAQRRVPLHTKILLGLALGAVCGIAANHFWNENPRLLWIVNNIAEPAGQIFLRMLFMVVVPLVFTSIALGVASIGDIGRVGRIGGKTLLFFLATTALAVVLGLIMVNLVKPGLLVSPQVRTELLAQYSAQGAEKVAAAKQNGFGINTFVGIVPKNPVAAAAGGDMLGLIFFTLIFGIALTTLPKAVSEPVIKVIEGIGQAVMVIIGFAMRLAPIGVFGLIFAVTARFGFDVLRSLGAFVLMVLAGLAIHLLISLAALARLLVNVGPREFFGRSRALMITAFSTSSSNATLPTTIRTAEEHFGVPREVAGFVLPLGATMNMNGTALFEGMTVIFLAQVFGIHLTLGTQILVVIMSVITAVGVAGVPSGSIPLIVLVLQMVGVPGEGIALILGVDRIMDMARTVPNVMGDLLTSMVVAKSEGMEFKPIHEPGPEID